ncbi:unnamed protein product [Caenorhabditis angaria]|uniref:Seven TM Receptor n=1 Tax=Caenorhabditis angaria TaxID=860376 RepID=A0A9P1IZ03_9PELO|nr:unnamed protein product [Caenorhabditis angaria]
MKSKRYVNDLHLFSTGISIFLNSLLIILILTKSSKHLGRYKYLMIYISIIELFYAILDCLLSPFIYAYNSIFLVIVQTTNNPLIKNKQVLLYLDSILCGFFGCFMGAFALQFIYRYYVVSGSIKIKSFNDYRMCFWMCIPILTGVIWGTVVHVLLPPTANIDNAIKSILLSDFDTFLENVTYVGLYLYQKQPDNSVQVDLQSMIGLGVMLTIIISSMSFIVICSIKCFLQLNIYLQINKSISKTYNNLQVQLMNALIVQTLIPLFFLHLPCLTIYILTLFNISLGRFSVILVITTTVFPALDPLPVMLIIKDYRCAITSIVTTRVVSVKNKSENQRRRHQVKI